MPLKKKIRMAISTIVDGSKFVMPGPARGFRVLLYHSVTERPIENEWRENTIYKYLFASQMAHLRAERYNIIRCEEAVNYLTGKGEIPDKTIAVTFDDGYRDNYLNALPILKKYDIPATVFLTADFLANNQSCSRYLGRSDITEMEKSGLIDFGCHGLSHKILSAMDDKELKRETKDAKHRLEDLLRREVRLFAYPFGHSGSYNQNVIEEIRSAGFLGAFTAIHGMNSHARNIFLMRRNRISWLDDLREFKKHLNGSYDWYSLFEPFGYKGKKS
jgi:peptidoglycan/xylan/chitin deacetylase (PgdA/CDA1 family)